MATEQLTPEQIATDVARAAQTAGIASPEIKLETGEVFKGATWEEVARNMASSKVETNKSYSQEKQQREELQAQLTLLSHERLQPVQTNGKAPAFDAVQYWELMNKGDIPGAQNLVDGFRFGVAPEQVIPTIAGSVDKTNKLWDRVEVEMFRMNNPEFPNTPEAARILMDAIGASGKEWDADILRHTFRDLVEQGKIEPVEGSEDNQQQPKKQFTGPMPVARGGSRGQQDVPMDMDEFAKLPIPKQEELLKKWGMME